MRNLITLVAAAGTALIAASAFAQSDVSQPPVYSGNTAGDALSDLTEGARLAYSLDATVAYTDNYFNQKDSLVSAWGGLLRPAIEYDYALPRFKFAGGVAAEAGRYQLSGESANRDNDSYIDTIVSLGASWLSAARHRFSWGADAKWGHDPFGTARTEGTAGVDSKLDQWRREIYAVKYNYGLPSSPFNLELRVGTLEKTYTTNRAFTKFLEFDTEAANGTLFYNFTPKTSALFDVLGARTRYNPNDVGLFDRGSDELRYRVGMRWLATAKTTGDVRVGYLTRTHTLASRRDFNGLDWQAAVGWTPRSYTQFNLQTGRHSQESYLTSAAFIDNQYVVVDWLYDWTPLLNTKVSLNYNRAEFVDNPTPRDDKQAAAALDVNYRLTPYLTVYGNTTYTQRTSTQEAREFDRFNAFAGVRFSR